MLTSFVFAAIFAGPLPVSVADLEKHSDKYNGCLVRIEVVLKDLTPGESWLITVGETEGVDVIGKTKPSGKNGDKVAITGMFRHKPNTFVPRAILQAKMEVVPFDVTPKDLNKRGQFDGRLVRVEGKIKEIDGTAFYLETFLLEVTWSGKPELSKGDRVRVTGVFKANQDTFLPGQIDVTKSGSVEKLEKP